VISQTYKDKIKKSIQHRFLEMGIDDETINELISVSIDSLTNELEEVYKILQSDDISELAIHTHTIKGILLNVGLSEDANQFKEIKHLIENGMDISEIKEITQKRISIFK